MCKPEEWGSMPDRFDNTWDILNKSSESSVSILSFISLALIM